jgi:Mrp family chromosome partitioning ATPase
MNALDQAFVKAYEQPTAAVVGPACVPSPTVSSPQPAPDASDNDGNSAPAPLAAESAHSVADPSASKPRGVRKNRSRARTRGVQRTTRRELTRPGVSANAEAGEKPASSHASRASSAGGPKPDGGFRPMLEVDAFLWPKNVDKLTASDQTAMQQLAGNLLKRVRRGQKVVGWQACRHGDGCSTLLLAAARHLAQQGLKVALVDADFRHPALARRLGLTPNSGWEEVAAGRLSLEEVLVESLQDRVSLAPWCASAPKDAEQSDESAATENASNPGPWLELLRKHYDMVLVDLGHGDADGPRRELLSAMRSGLDAILVVHKADEVPHAELRRVCRTLSRTGKAKLAIVENFV